jgi:hypothetical protein
MAVPNALASSRNAGSVPPADPQYTATRFNFIVHPE